MTAPALTGFAVLLAGLFFVQPLVWVPGLVLLLFTVGFAAAQERCPGCRRHFGRLDLQKIRFCPYCGLNFESEISS